MRNKLILFLMLALFGSSAFLRADEVQIGVGGTTTNSYLPSYSLYNYSLTQQIYTADEIGVGECTINSIAFYNSGSEKVRDYTMYLVNTDKESFAGTADWITVSAADEVFTGTVTMATGVWTTFTLNTPFAYTGGNLAVIMDDNTGSWSSGMACYAFSASSQAIRVYSDPTNYDPMNPAGYSGTIETTKNQIILDVTVSSTPVGPVIPTGEFGITPSDEFALNYRPLNGWMEPFSVRIFNGGEPTVVSASMSNTSEQNPFLMPEILDMTLETDDAFDFVIEINPAAPAAEYTEEFTMFYAASGKDIITIPVTGNLYTAVAPDIVEVPQVVSWSSDSYSNTPNMANIHPNYNLYGMDEMKNDAVYKFTLDHDYLLTTTVADAEFVAVYAYEDGLQLNAEVEPVIIGESGAFTNKTILAGSYCLVVAGDNIGAISMSRTSIPAPTDITYIEPSPADGQMEVDAPVTLAWDGGDNATEYQVLFGTVYPPTVPVVDWTMMDDNYGSYTIEDLAASTQYFWQIKARNSEDTVEGPVWGFTTTLTPPNNVTASEVEIFTDESTLIKWRYSGASSGFTGELTVADGTVTNSYIPLYGLWLDDYTRSEMIYPAEMLEEMLGGEITSLTYYISTPASSPWTGDEFNVYMMEVDGTTLSSYYTSTDAEIVYTGSLNGTSSTLTINLDTPYTYSGGNLLVGIEETTAVNYSSCYFYGVSAPGASASGYNSGSLAAVTFNQRDFLPKTTFTCGGRGYRPEPSRSFIGFNVYYGQMDPTGSTSEYVYTKANTELITERQYTLSNLPYDMDGLDINVTAVYDEGESTHSTPEVLVQVSGYGTFTGTVTEMISGAPIAGATVKFSGKDEFNNNVSFQGTTNTSGVYTINNVKAGNYTGMATLEGLEPSYSDPVTLAYNTTETVNFTMHEVYKPVYSVYAEELEPETSKVSWSMNTTITGSGSGTGSGGAGDEFFENFDNSMMPAGWTTIDADGDGSNWMLGSVAMSTGYGHNGSTDMILSKSYDNSVGILYPDNYLVTPRVTVGSGSTFSFFACAQDAGYAGEHYGVAVSTGGATASEFTMLQEWTMTAKGSGVMATGRDGQTRDQGVWYEKTVDLSAYAGQQVYIAIRHFNCHDMFYLDVDDISLSNSSKDRSVQSYNVYRKAILKEVAPTDADSVMLVDNYTDTVYADVHWGDMEPGLYQYGVSAVYPAPPTGGKSGNREEVIIGEGTTTNNYVPTYNLYNYSCTNQIYTAEEIGGAGTIYSIAFMPVTVNVASRNLDIYMVNTEKTSFASGTDWIPVSASDLVYSGPVNWNANAWSTIELTNPFDFDGSNLCIVVNDLTGSWTSSNSYKVDDAPSQAIRIYQDTAPYNPASPGSGTVLNVKNQIKLDITFGGAASNDDPNTPITWSNILPKDMEATVIVNAVNAAGSTEGVAVNFVNTFESGYNVVAEMDETGTVVFEDFRKGNYTLSVTLPDYISNYEETAVGVWGDTVVFDVVLEEVFKPVEILEVSNTGFARWTNMLPEEPERVAQRYHVTLDDIFQGETTDNFMPLNTENLTVGETYTAAVAVVYTTGMSAFVTKDFVYLGCEATATQVEDLEGHAECMNVVLTWNGGAPPTPTPPTPPTPPTGEIYDFEDGTMQGWTPIDADGDGYNWLTAVSTLGSGYGHNGSTNMVFSQSYDNNYGPLTPNNYLVSPSKAEYPSISFYACAQDASYAAEHFGVAVSTGGATASEFTMVQEWTMTAKGSGIVAPGRDGQNRAQGTWREYFVDLSAYAGQDIWVAIRHFNCTDMFYLNVDDISLGGGTPGPTPPTPPTPPTGDTYTFDDGMQGWTTIDGGSPSGYGWHLGSTTLGTGYGHNGSADLVISQSYDNNYGVIYPDNYLISPAKAEYTAISLWACGQDASYAAEHFGVAVSTGGATASEFTMVQEWTIGSKGERYAGARGNRDQSTWTEYTVDLSAYAGQEIWVAVRHFNCSDMYFLDVDDITLGVPEKSANKTAETCGYTTSAPTSRAMWDVLASFNAAEAAHYGVVTDGQYIYTSNWGYSSATYNFYKYDMDGNMIEGFNISGCGTLRGMTFDGQYVYGVANAATIYCVDLNNHTLISTTNSAYGAMRGITYDSERDGFWVIGNWAGNLTLIDRTGAIVQVGPEPQSASDLAYFKDADGVEHVYCFNNADNGIYDYNINTNTLGGQVFNFFNVPGVASDASSGGCHIANYNGKLAFFGDMQQSPNFIAILELGEAGVTPGGGGASAVTPGKFNVFKDGVVIAATNDNYYIYEAEDTDEHLYEVYYVDANYNFSCAVEGVVVAAGAPASVTDLNYTMDDPDVTLTWNGVAQNYVIWRGMLEGNSVNLETVGETTELTFTDVLPAEAGDVIYVVQAVYGEGCETSLQDELYNNNYVLINYDDVNETEIVNAIYPNPTSGDLHINANGMTRISVINALGQMVYDAEVNADQVILNMAQYNAGIYMVNIVTVNGSTVKRVVVTK